MEAEAQKEMTLQRLEYLELSPLCLCRIVTAWPSHGRHVARLSPKLVRGLDFLRPRGSMHGLHAPNSTVGVVMEILDLRHVTAFP